MATALRATGSGFDRLRHEILGPVLHLPRHPVELARFGLPGLLSATILSRVFSTPQGRALFAGAAAHSFSPLGRPMSSAVGMALLVSGHAGGWPVARGGSRAVCDALASVVDRSGGKIETVAGSSISGRASGGRRRRISTWTRAGCSGSPANGCRIGSAVPTAATATVRDRSSWTWPSREACRGPATPAGAAGTVHVGGTLEEIADAERRINRGEMPARPFVLVCQQYLADPSRSSGDVHPVWAYAHVPAGYEGDAGEAVLDQIERFAPGLGNASSVASSVRPPGSSATTRTMSAATSRPERTLRFRW